MCREQKRGKKGPGGTSGVSRPSGPHEIKFGATWGKAWWQCLGRFNWTDFTENPTVDCGHLPEAHAGHNS